MELTSRKIWIGPILQFGGHGFDGVLGGQGMLSTLLLADAALVWGYSDATAHQ
ncbi:hypothetical protein ACK32K_10355 [Aeromonas dhakensis]|uniref:hypothetical protein n=1 Tax=Aeromonas dhakensis TaxID=196024 RepID=UPI00398736BE